MGTPAERLRDYAVMLRKIGDDPRTRGLAPLLGQIADDLLEFASALKTPSEVRGARRGRLRMVK